MGVGGSAVGGHKVGIWAWAGWTVAVSLVVGLVAVALKAGEMAAKSAGEVAGAFAVSGGRRPHQSRHSFHGLSSRSYRWLV